MADVPTNPPPAKWPDTQPTEVTAEALWKRPDDGYRYELVKGKLRKMPPAGFEHGTRAMDIGWRLAQYVSENRLGRVLAAETGFRISQNPDTVRAPDVAFVRQASIDRQGMQTGYWDGAPDLAVEIISPNDTYTEVAEKVDEWLRAGCAMVWVVNPRREIVEVYRSAGGFAALGGDDVLEGGDVIAGFRCRVGDLFV